MIKTYETTFIIDAHLSTDETEAIISKYLKFFEKNNARVIRVDRWGKRRLAYEIARKQYGFYFYIQYEADGAFNKELERQYSLDERVLRHLTIFLPKKWLEAELAKQRESAAEQPAVEEAEPSERTAAKHKAGSRKKEGSEANAEFDAS
ncbi:30S ribosomal protein S6 [bacterium]|nr:30S ribosomal protein S6 [bacterium]